VVSGAGLVGGYVLAWGRSLVVVDREEGEVRRVWGAPGWWRQVAVPLDQFTHVAIVRERVSGHAPGRPDYLFRVQLAGAAPLELRVEATYEQARALAVPVAEALDWELVTR
jgi:hypothetical protein